MKEGRFLRVCSEFWKDFETWSSKVGGPVAIKQPAVLEPSVTAAHVQLTPVGM